MCLVSIAVFPLLLTALLADTPAAPIGVYRTAAQYHRRQPAAAGTDVRRSDKRSSLVVTQQRGPARLKILVPLDSAWGYVNAKGRSFRLYRGVEYQVQQADTLTIYTTQNVQQYMSAMVASKTHYFSRGLNGMVYPLTEKNLRLAYEASSPGFVQAVKDLGFAKDLTLYDAQADTYRVVQLYRQSLGK